MAIEVPRRAIIIVAAALVVGLTVLMGALGWANSPRDSQGHPLLLNPERRAILRYLVVAEGWAKQLTEVGALLDGLMPVTTEEPPAPDARPADLYQRTHDARRARALLGDLEREMEQECPPDALVGLHSLAVDALSAHLVWADSVLVYVGAPEAVDAGTLEQLRTNAQAALTSLKEVLTIER